jgi:hypothetical protein
MVSWSGILQSAPSSVVLRIHDVLLRPLGWMSQCPSHCAGASACLCPQCLLVCQHRALKQFGVAHSEFVCAARGLWVGRAAGIIFPPPGGGRGMTACGGGVPGGRVAAPAGGGPGPAFSTLNWLPVCPRPGFQPVASDNVRWGLGFATGVLLRKRARASFSPPSAAPCPSLFPSRAVCGLIERSTSTLAGC